MKLLVVGSGGREHAVIRKLKKSIVRQEMVVSVQMQNVLISRQQIKKTW